MRSNSIASAILVTVLCGPFLHAVAPDAEVVAAAVKTLPSYRPGGARDGMNTIDAHIVANHGNAPALAALEEQLLTVLKTSPDRAVVDYICRTLSRIGTDAAVPNLSSLLTAPENSHTARYALERIKTPAAATAIRNALKQAPPTVKPGLIQSLGAMGDTASVSTLASLASDGNAAVAESAILGLGAIGTSDAVNVLLPLKAKAPAPLQETVSHALLAAATALGNGSNALTIYKQLNVPEEPVNVRLAAYRGHVINAPASEAADLIANGLSSTDQVQRGLALKLARRAPGQALTEALATKLQTASPSAQESLLAALGQRRDRAARPAVRQLLENATGSVRQAALEALGTIGTVEDVEALAQAAASTDRTEAGIAADALSALPGTDIDNAIIQSLGNADKAARIQLLRALGKRCTKAGTPQLLEAAKDEDGDVRRAALEALGSVADADQASALVAAILAAPKSSERSAAEKSLASVCDRTSEGCADAIVAGLEKGDTTTRCCLLRSLGRAKGEKAVKALRAALAGTDDEIRATAIRVLSEWSDQGAAEDLLALAQKTENTRDHVLALRGYISVVGRIRKESDGKTRDLETAIQTAKRRDEKVQALGELGKIPADSALTLAATMMDTSDVADEAASAALAIVKRLKIKSDASKAGVAAAMKKVLEVSTNDDLKKKAETYLKKYEK